MLELRYKQDLQAVQVTLSEQPALWPAVRSALEENSDEVTTIGSNSLRLPVWAFVSCRGPLAYTLTKYDIQVDADEGMRQILASAVLHAEAYKRADSLPVVSPGELARKLASEGFVRTLTEHQLRNVLKLIALPSGATFSVPGAGKTTEALAFYYYRRAQDSRLFVVCPKNAFAVWEEQLGLCLTDTPVPCRLVGGSKRIETLLAAGAQSFLITYQQLPNVQSVVAEYLHSHPTYMVLDESHHIKRGTGGQWCNAVLALSHLPISRLIMTGTPLPNSVADLVPQFSFLYPGIPVEERSVEALIKPVFVRTTKRELGLPAIDTMFTPIRLPPRHRELYELLRSETARQLAGITPRDRNRFRRIGRSVMRLLQLVANPALLVKDSTDIPAELQATLDEGDAPKIQYACYRARSLARQGRKVIIWSGFIDNVELISDRLSDIGADYIHGGVEAGSEEEQDTREAKIRRFHLDDEAHVLVANPAACAESISLHTVCHHAIYVDRNYNAAQYLQSVDRIHRLGLPPDIATTIEILFSPDTIDESVSQRLRSKVQRMSDVLNDSSIAIEPFAADLEQDDVLDDDDVLDFLNHLNRR